MVKRPTDGCSWREVAGIWAGETDGIETIIRKGRERSRKRREFLDGEPDEG